MVVRPTEAVSRAAWTIFSDSVSSAVKGYFWLKNTKCTYIECLFYLGLFLKF